MMTRHVTFEAPPHQPAAGQERICCRIETATVLNKTFSEIITYKSPHLQTVRISRNSTEAVMESDAYA